MKHKHIHRLFLAFLLLTAFCCSAAAADSSDFVIKGNELIEYRGAGGNIIVPDGVTSIGASAFCEKETITGVTIPSSVAKIEICAFSGCTNLKTVNLPDGLLEIGRDAFEKCAMQRIDIPDSVLFIEEEAFSRCASLAEVHLPSTAQVEYNSFYHTPWAETNAVVIEERMPTVGYGGVTEYTTAQPSTPTTQSGDFILRGTTVVGYRGKGGDIILPDGVTAIGARAFYQNTKITSVTVPESLRGIGMSAFEGCISLNRVSPLSDDFLRVCQKAFSGCANLTTFDMPARAQADRTAFTGTPYEATRGEARMLDNPFVSTRKYDGRFSDATNKLWCYTYFVKAYEAGLMDGINGKFQPNGTLTVAEAVKIAATIHAAATGNTDRLQASSPWYQTYYDYMARYSSSDISDWQETNRPIRRDEFAFLLYEALPYSEWTAHGLKQRNFPDLEITRGGITESNPYRQYIDTLYTVGVCVAYEDGKFHPDWNIKRGEAVVMVARVIEPSLRVKTS